MNVRAPRRSLALVAASLALLAAARPAGAVVISGDGHGLTVPHGFVGMWNGSSAVAIGSHWLVTARHVGGHVGATVTLHGTTYTADRIVHHPSADIQLVRVDEALSGFHRRAAAAPGDRVVLAGVGSTRGEPITHGYGWAPGTGEVVWGENTADGVGVRIVMSFDRPDSGRALPSEAAFALHDSGGGVFTQDAEGRLWLAGIAASVSGARGTTLYGSMSFATNLDPFNAWITAIIEPGRPIASSMEPPPRDGVAPTDPVPPAPAPGSLALVLLCGLAASYRRRG